MLHDWDPDDPGRHPSYTTRSSNNHRSGLFSSFRNPGGGPPAGGGSSRMLDDYDDHNPQMLPPLGLDPSVAATSQRDMMMSSHPSTRSSSSSGLPPEELLRRFLYDLSSSNSPKKVRLESLRFAVEFFSHSNEQKHSDEIYMGATDILFSKLAFSYTISPLDEEVAHASTCLERILGGASRDALNHCWETSGLTVLPLIIDVLAAGFEAHSLAVGHMMKVLRYFSRNVGAMVPIAMTPNGINAILLHCVRPEDKGALGGSFDSEDDHHHYHHREEERERQGYYDGEESTLGGGKVPRGPPPPLQHQHSQQSNHSQHASTTRRIDALATLTNLACAEENKFMMANHPALLNHVTAVANTDPSSTAREHAATILMNLSYHESNKVPMAQRTNVLETLVVLLGDSSPNTRRYASAALFTLACVACNAGTFARDGRIVESLRTVMLEDSYDLARINAAEALCTMARSDHATNTIDDEESAGHSSTSSSLRRPSERMANHPELIDSLADAIIKDDNLEVKNFAASTLEYLASDVHFPAAGHSTLLSALARSASWTGSVSIAEAIKNQAYYKPNRRPMVEHDRLLDSIATMAHLDGYDVQYIRDCAMGTIERLSKEPSTKLIMADHQGIMTALSVASFSPNTSKRGLVPQGSGRFSASGDDRAGMGNAAGQGGEGGGYFDDEVSELGEDDQLTNVLGGEDGIVDDDDVDDDASTPELMRRAFRNLTNARGRGEGAGGMARARSGRRLEGGEIGEGGHERDLDDDGVVGGSDDGSDREGLGEGEGEGQRDLMASQLNFQ